MSIKDLITKPRIIIMIVLSFLLVLLHNISLVAGILIVAGAIIGEFVDKGV